MPVQMRSRGSPRSVARVAVGSSRSWVPSMISASGCWPSESRARSSSGPRTSASGSSSAKSSRMPGSRSLTHSMPAISESRPPPKSARRASPATVVPGTRTLVMTDDDAIRSRADPQPHGRRHRGHCARAPPRWAGRAACRTAAGCRESDHRHRRPRHRAPAAGRQAVRGRPGRGGRQARPQPPHRSVAVAITAGARRAGTDAASGRPHRLRGSALLALGAGLRDPLAGRITTWSSLWRPSASPSGVLGGCCGWPPRRTSRPTWPRCPTGAVGASSVTSVAVVGAVGGERRRRTHAARSRPPERASPRSGPMPGAGRDGIAVPAGRIAGRPGHHARSSCPNERLLPHRHRALRAARRHQRPGRLRVHAAWSTREVELTYDELLAMPLFEQYVTIACV